MGITAGGFVDAIVKRLSPARPTDCFILIVGPRRSGKTWASISLAETIGDKTGLPYDIHKHNFFTTESFLNAINKGELKPRQVVTLQELGVSMARRNWFKESNKSFNSVAQIMGVYRLCVIATLPSLKLLDPHQVLLANYVLESMGEVNPRTKTSSFHAKVISHNPILGKTWFPNFRFYHPGEIIPTQLQRLEIAAPEQGKDFDDLDLNYKKNLAKYEQIEMRRNLESLGDAIAIVQQHAVEVQSVRRKNGKIFYPVGKLEGFGLSSTMAKRVKYYLEKEAS